MASAPLMASTGLLGASTGLVDINGRPLANTVNATQSPAEFSAKLMRESLLASLNLVPAVGGLLSYIGALFIPSPGQTPDQMWRKIVDARISEALYRKVQRDLVGLTESADKYRKIVSTGDMNAIREASIALDFDFTNIVPGFQIPGEEISTLPLFVIAATMHLCLLRDMTLNGKAIDLKETLVEIYRQDLKKRISTYTSYVDRHVAAAIDKAKSSNPWSDTPDRRNSPLSPMLETKAAYQLSVLDVQATWWAFDAAQFPGRIRVSLTREIYAPIAGWWGVDSPVPNYIPVWVSRIDPRPISLRMWERKLTWRTRFMNGFSMDYANDSDQSGTFSGDMYTLDLRNRYIDEVSVYSSVGISRMIFRLNDGKTRTFGREPEDIIDRRLTYRYADHYLSSLRSAGTGLKGSAAEGAVCGCLLGFSLIDNVAKSISPQAFDQIAPKMAPRLLDWVAS